MPILRGGMTACLVVCSTACAQAEVRISVDLASQTMHVEAKDTRFDWQISSGKPGYETPSGSYKVLWLDKDHHSQEYDQAPMPNAIFFAPGFAIHGFARSAWGRAASHGCVRLPLAKAAILFSLVKEQGASITIGGETPAGKSEERFARRVVYDAIDGNGRARYVSTRRSTSD